MVLIINGDPTQVGSIVRACRKASPQHDICCVSNGQQAVELLSYPNVAKNLELVFLSLSLPRRPGLEVLDLLRSSDDLWAVPVVVVAEAVTQTDLQRVYDTGANSCLDVGDPSGEFEIMVQTEAAFWLGLERERVASPARA